MPRHLNLRQIEAFQAVIEAGSLSGAANLLHVSQPAMSKLIAHLESDTGLRLFDRVKGRLSPTENALLLHDEVGRIFSGMRQVESAIEAIRRERFRRLAVGVMPALSNSFIQRATSQFLVGHESVFCLINSLPSHWIVDWLASRKLDIGLVGNFVHNPYVALEPLMEQPLVCIMPPAHPLSAKRSIKPSDLHQIPFVAFHREYSDIGRRVDDMFDAYGVKAHIVLVSNVAPTVCEFVASGLGVSLVHPLMASGLETRLIARRFEPSIPDSFQLCYNTRARSPQLIERFADAVRTTATEVSRSLIGDS
jgi:DNA-binding transcriptional LysR family regulator